MPITSKTGKARMLDAALGLEVAAIPLANFTARWVTDADAIIAAWTSVTRLYTDASDSVVFEGAARQPSAAGNPTKNQLLVSGTVDYDDTLTLTNDSGATIPNNEVTATDECVFSLTSTLGNITNLNLSNACRKRMMRASCGLGSSAITGMQFKLTDGTQDLIVWDNVTFSADDSDANTKYIVTSSQSVAATASGTPTRFQVMNGATVEIDMPASNATITLEGNTVNTITSGQNYQITNFRFYV